MRETQAEKMKRDMMNFGLADQVVCVTGGAAGIGKACGEALAREGARIGIMDRQQECVDAAVADLKAMGATVAGCAVDVRDRDAVETAATVLEAALGPVDHLIGCAGTSRVAMAQDITERDFGLVMDVNVKGLFFCCQAFGRRMVAQGGRSITLIGSLDGIGGHTGRTQYVASKFAVVGLTKNLALEWGRYGLRVNCVAPSFVDTPEVRQFTRQSYIEDVVCNRTPLQRLVTRDEVANATLMLLSDAASFITGVTLPVDGGLTTGFVANAYGADLGGALSD
jgi:NAD(P)-dependent dehydrogenase (short-subunit alcohol dehydrogenase family)